jgi:hypothetical protein
MQKHLDFVIVFLLLIWSGCGDNESPPQDLTVEVEVPVLSIPGTLQIPGENGFSPFQEKDHNAVLLYCWLPIGEYPESEADLLFLTSIEENGVTALPVQFSTNVRNASQEQLNTLGIHLAVSLGDDSLRAFMGVDILPTAVLVKNTGEVIRSRGFGCAERVLRSIQ